MTMSLTDAQLLASASAQRAALDQGAVSAVELTRAYLKRIEAENGALRGFVHLEADEALEQAQNADLRLRAGERGPVLGLTFGVKDIIDVAGMPTTYGSRAFANNIAPSDAGAVARLRQAGGVILGKTNTFEFALVMPSPLHRESRNPWDMHRVAGGSSNGSATAASAGLCAIAIGSDTAGSIRNPAAYCGVTGLKPTHGRTSIRGVGVLSSSMDTVGPMARSVADCALALQVLAGHDPEDAHSADAPVDRYQDLGGRLVIGVPDTWGLGWLDQEIEANWHEVLGRLQARGLEIRTIPMPDVSDLAEVWAAIASAEALDWHQPYLMSRRADYGAGALAVFDQMQAISAAAHAAGRRRAFALRRAITAAMAGVDVLVAPTTPTTAFTFQEAKTNQIAAGGRALDSGTATTGLTRLFSITGQPALALPSGVAANGMPMSLQIAGRRFDEAKVLHAGRLIEAVCGFNVTPPMFRQP